MPMPTCPAYRNHFRDDTFAVGENLEVSVSDPHSSHISGDHSAAPSHTGFTDKLELSAFAFQRTRLPMVVADARQDDLPLVLVNDAFLELTGYGSEEVLGRNCRFLQGEGTARAAVAEIRDAIMTEREAIVEILNYKKDGTPFWNELHLSPLHDEQGQLTYVFASQVDVTNYRRVQAFEEAERRLLLEIDHRTKNVLAIVDSIVRLSKADDVKVYSTAVQRRIQALSRIHMLLADNGWKRVSLADIVHTQTEAFGAEKIEVLGPDVMVAAASVQPLGLAIHELAVNAAVHGSLALERGALRVSWNCVGEGISLEWREEGPPVPSKRSGRGFGNILLAAVVENQLGGKIRRQWCPDGLRLTIELPSLERIAGSLRRLP